MKLPRKILDRWRELSGNAAKLLVWLAVHADRNGVLETTFEDIGRGCGWVWKKTTQRAMAELEANRLIEGKRAANQYEITRIRILNCDREERKVDTGGTSKEAVAVVPVGDSKPAEDTAEDKSYHSGLPDLAPAAIAVWDVAEDKNNSAEDKILRKQDLAGRIAATIADSGSGVDQELDEEITAYLGFTCDRKYLSVGFINAVLSLYTAHADNLPLPGKFCAAVIERLLSKQRECRASGKDSSRWLWPPELQSHTSVLRRRERLGRLRAGERVAVAVV